jgi:nucleoside-diphosphate-sugar epimerase
MDVAVLGMGRMGSALAGRLLGDGHRVVVWNRSPGRAPELVAAGAWRATPTGSWTLGTRTGSARDGLHDILRDCRPGPEPARPSMAAHLLTCRG